MNENEKRHLWFSRPGKFPVFVEEDGRAGALITSVHHERTMAWLSSVEDYEMLTSPGLPERPLGEFKRKWRSNSRDNRSGFCAGVDPFDNWLPLPLGAAEYIQMAVKSLCKQLGCKAPDQLLVQSSAFSLIASCKYNPDESTSITIIIERDERSSRRGHWKISELYRTSWIHCADGVSNQTTYYEWSREQNGWVIQSQK